MTADLALTIGLLLAVFSVPSAVSALVEGRGPRLSSVMMVLGGGCVVYALQTKPGGYALSEVPDVVIRTLAGFVS